MELTPEIQQAIEANDIPTLVSHVQAQPELAGELTPELAHAVLFELGKANPEAVVRAIASSDTLNTAEFLANFSHAALSVFLYEAVEEGKDYNNLKLMDNIIKVRPTILKDLKDIFQMSDDQLVHYLIHLFSKRLGEVFMKLMEFDPETVYNLVKVYQENESIAQNMRDNAERLMNQMINHFGKARVGIPELLPGEEQTYMPHTQRPDLVKMPAAGPQFANSTNALLYLITGEEGGQARQGIRLAQEDDPELQAFLSEAEQQLRDKGVPEDRIPLALESKKKFFFKQKKKKEKEVPKEAVREQFMGKLQGEGSVPTADMVEAVKTLTGGKIDPEIEDMLTRQQSWSPESLNILAKNLTEFASLPAKYKDKIKPFNHMLGISGETGFVHSSVPNSDGFSIFTRWWNLPEDMKGLEGKMRSSQAADHGGGHKDLVGYVGVTPYRIKKGDKTIKKAWTLQEIQAPMVANIAANANPQEANKVQNYFKDWYKLLYNKVLKLAKKYNVDEIWVTPSESVMDYWAGQGQGDLRDTYKKMKESHTLAQKYMDAPDKLTPGEKEKFFELVNKETQKWKKRMMDEHSIPEADADAELAKRKDEIVKSLAGRIHAWERYYDEYAKELGGKEQNVGHDLKYMGDSTPFRNDKFIVINTADVPEERLAHKMAVMRLSASLIREAYQIQSIPELVDRIKRHHMHKEWSDQENQQWIDGLSRVIREEVKQQVRDNPQEFKQMLQKAMGSAKVNKIYNVFEQNVMR